MILLAHRGLWKSPEQRNTRDAFRAAFARGYGVELDVRDRDGELVISHDMPVGAQLSFADVLSDYAAAGAPGWMAINVKADGLAPSIEAMLAHFPNVASRSFVFDMSVPDTLAYLGREVLVFTRHSDHEPTPPLENQTSGTWMDCFGISWVENSDVIDALRRGRMVAIVSPELHKRDLYRQYWEVLKAGLAESGITDDVIQERLMLCTDFPEEADLFFHETQQ